MDSTIASIAQHTCGQNAGIANYMLSILIRTLLTAQCTITPKDMWPADYGKIAVEKGEQ